ncbi:DNA mismatch repair endonuclease MutL [cyanobacterium endosymbiont of Epithemia turgida]|uniref:DNA mismatch repair endonuclease MutL n=1 Tax=cyanobacterium endosymbiont of Epithemia turgida TaxID=718217 RepID=UPI0004D12BA6|nr:DNA mismatch repair endonuclease MutL [cyanobacterium endosymbiont of Epithemia turgida]BAP17455.1 DNA mismatch repair protein [cyanobacterium endosymbiont of Epithemia turgida isolate EtSB Lake Yunoko]
MSPPIQPLPSDVVSLIAAGEVIDSLAAVVRELSENALDAQATRLVISLLPEAWRVKVADNGEGMSLDDLRNCAKPHSTSKITHFNDLAKITSLGFRGEALHSLAQVCELEISSRYSIDPQGIGWHLHYNKPGEPITEKPTAIAPGTIVTGSNLFVNMPVRRQGLPSLSQQLKEVQAIVENLALCHPQVNWQVWHNERLWLNISPGKTAQDILPQLLKQVHHHDLQFVSQQVKIFDNFGLQSLEKAQSMGFPLPPLEKNGLVEVTLGLPDRCHRRRPDWVKVGINGRVVRLPQLEQTILMTFSRTLPKDRFPICFLNLTISPNHIDWNRHPTKAKIYLYSLNFWKKKISEIIEQGLRLFPQTLSIAAQNQRVEKLLKNKNYNIIPNTSNEIRLMPLKAVAQVRNTYIVAEHSSGLWLIEQHIAQERVLYEKLQRDWEFIGLDTPIILTKILNYQVEQLQRIGLEVEEFGREMWAVRTIPKILSRRDDLQDALTELSLGGDLETAQVAIACRSAIRNGTPMNLFQMQDLLDSWRITKNPRTCPHGRPIYLSLEDSFLSRFFLRHWVIGKSHGI